MASAPRHPSFYGCPVGHFGVRMRSVEVALVFVSTDPPTGEVSVADERRSFVGWLELMRVLTELVEATSRPTDWSPS